VTALRLDIEDQPFEVHPERLIRNRKLTDLLALREDRQTLALVIEVIELQELEEVLEDREVLVVRPWSAVAPLSV